MSISTFLIGVAIAVCVVGPLIYAGITAGLDE